MCNLRAHHQTISQCEKIVNEISKFAQNGLPTYVKNGAQKIIVNTVVIHYTEVQFAIFQFGGFITAIVKVS